MSYRATLSREDLQSHPDVVMIERLGRSSRPVVRRATKSGRLVVCMQDIHSTSRTDWYETAVHDGYVRKFGKPVVHMLGHPWRAEDEALAVVEPVYKYLESQGLIPTAPLKELYRDDDVELAFKKNLLNQLSEFYRTAFALELLKTEGVRSIEFFPSRDWQEVAEWIQGAGVSYRLPEGVRIMRGVGSALIRLESQLDRVLWTMILLGLPFGILLCIRKVVWSRVPVQEIQAVLRVYGTDWGFRGSGSRDIDWLLDGKRLHRGNTLFVIEKPILETYRAEFERRQYRTHDVSNTKAFKVMSLAFLVQELMGNGFRAWRRLIATVSSMPAAFRKVAAYGLVEYLRWTLFLEQWKPRHWVVYNHFHFEHIFRNSRLHAVGCLVWYYVHSINDSPVYTHPSKSGMRVESDWGYLAYDKEVHWGALDARFTRHMHGHSKTYVSWGPLWSAFVQPHPALESKVKELRREQSAGPIVAAFDTTFGADSVYRDEDMVEFYDGLHALLDQPEWPNLIILFKPKNSLDHVRLNAVPQTFESMRKLVSHLRCMTVGHDVAPGGVIAEADLTVSIAFTTPTVEAIGARRRAIYYDPVCSFPDSYFDQFPNVVAHDGKTLVRLCTHWLKCPEAEFQSYLDRYIAPAYGGFLDAGAVERFRASLAV